MAANSRNRDVLKLVHPGGIKEILSRPIRACEVMKKYPRHCVTRPDVFKFPWIVIHPDSVLEPGGVFYVVPNHTIHCLRRRVKPEKYDASRNKRSVVENDFFEQARTVQFLSPAEQTEMSVDDLQDEQSPSLSGTRSKIDFKYEDWQGDDIFPNCLLSPELKKRSPIKSTLDIDNSSKKSWRSDYGIKNRQESKLKRSDVETDFPKKQGPLEHLENGSRRASLQQSMQRIPLKHLFEMEATNSLKEVHDVKNQHPAISVNGSQETKQEIPVTSNRFSKLKNIQHIADSPRKCYPVEGWDRTLNFKGHQEATKQSPHKSRLESDNLPQHHADSPKNIYMIEPAQSLLGGEKRERTEKQTTFSPPVKSRRHAFSSDVSTDDNPIVIPAKADGVCESSSSNKDARTLKSCLKNNSTRSRGLRVKFHLPGEVEEELRVQVFQFEPADSS